MMRRRYFLLACLLGQFSCFDFIAAEFAAVGGVCGDSNHLCEEGLQCVRDVCTRPGGGLAGEVCSATLGCSIDFACIDGLCGDPCALATCGEFGGCVVDAAEPSCVCAEGYVAWQRRCLGIAGSVCGENQPCDTGFTCQLGRCANSCTGVACSSRGRCVVDGMTPTCECESPYVVSGLDCVEPDCVPTSHYASACDSGHVYWYDSCGAREELKDDCSVRGCGASGCNPVTWEDRSMTFSGTQVRDFDFAVTSSGEIIGVVARATGLFLQRRNRAGQSDFGNGNTTIPTSAAPMNVALALDKQDRPNLFYGPNRMQFVRWNGIGWEGLAGSNIEGDAVSSAQIGGGGMRIVLDSADYPYLLTVGTIAGSMRPCLKRWTGGAWGVLGSEQPFAEGTSVQALVFDRTSEVYVVTSRVDAGAVPISIEKWAGYGWTSSSPVVTATSSAGYAISGARNVLAYVQGSEILARRVEDGAVFTDVVSINTSETLSDSPGVVTDAGGQFIVSWGEYGSPPGPSSSRYGVYVRRWDGVSWSELGEGSATGRGLVDVPGSVGFVGAPQIRARGPYVCVSWHGHPAEIAIRCAAL